MGITASLKSAGLLRSPVIQLHPDIPSDAAASLRATAERLGAQVGGSASDITHELFPFEAPEEADDDDWFRTLERSGARSLVHWWYFPDSHDAWVPESDAGDPEPAPPHSGRWRVSARWLLDSAKFNEWMNEEDYEVEDDAADAAASSSSTKAASPAKSAASRDAKNRRAAAASAANDDESAPRKRARSSAPEPTADALLETPAAAVDLQAEAGKMKQSGRRTIELEPLPTGTTANLSSGNMSEGPGHPPVVVTEPRAPASISGEVASSGNGTEVDAAEQEEVEARMAQQKRALVIPSYAAWFSFDQINDVRNCGQVEFVDIGVV